MRQAFPSFIYSAIVIGLGGFFISCSSSKHNPTPIQKKAEVYYGQGTDNLVAKDYTMALKNLLMAADLNPDDSRIQNNLGMAYYFKGQYPEAQSHLERAIKLDPKNSDARNNLASLFFSKGDHERAEKEYSKVAKDLVYTQQFRVSYNLGLIELAKGNTRKAEGYFRESIQDNGDYCPAHYRLGEMYYKTQEFREALEEFYAASKGTCFDEPAPQFYQGMCLWQLRKLPEAKSKFQEVTGRFPGTQYAQFAKSKLRELQDVPALVQDTVPEKKFRDKKLNLSQESLPDDLLDFTKKNKQDTYMDKTYATPQF